MSKRIASLLLAVVLVIGVLSIGAYAYSNDTSTYYFSFSGKDSRCETDVIKKSGGTSAYVYCSKANYAWYASVGAGNVRHQYKYDQNEYSDSVYIEGEDDAWIPNSVFERGFEGIYLIGKPSRSDSYSAQGMWNSDSGS